MLGIYFSGTGNSRHAAELFVTEYEADARAISIEDVGVAEAIKEASLLVFAYPVQYSDIPKFLRDFITKNKELWRGKQVFVIATMAMFSGDGAGVLGRMLQRFGAEIVGGLHLIMPDSIADEKVLKRSLEKNVLLVKKAECKIRKAVRDFKAGKPTKDGMGMLSRMAGFFSQRFWFGHRTKKYSDKLRIDEKKCVSCGICERLCPTNNLKIANKKAVQNNRCTVCYRCVNNCPKQAITLLGKTVVEQGRIEKYLE